MASQLALHTVVEMPEYLRRAQRLLSEGGRKAIVDYLAEHPRTGSVIPGTGGIRKLRWAREGMGKRGGVRVIYYYHDANIPVYLLTLFGKGERDDLTQAERNQLSEFVKTLVEHWRKR